MPNLRTLVERDLAVVLEDRGSGFAWDITVTDPAGLSAGLTGRSSDISQIIDPDTGQTVSGRAASVTLRLSTLTAKGLGLPRSISQETLRPWVVTFNDIGGQPHTFKVIQSNPDRTAGVVVCHLEAYA